MIYQSDIIVKDISGNQLTLLFKVYNLHIYMIYIDFDVRSSDTITL